MLGLLTNINKKCGKKIKFGPPPPGPLGCDFFIFIRMSFRVLKLHMGFILTQKGDINPPKNSETPPGPFGDF